MQPAWLMTNWIAPVSDAYWPELKSEHTLVAAYGSDTPVYLTDPEDVGTFAAAAFLEADGDINNMGKFAGKIIRIAGDVFTGDEIVKTMSRVSGLGITLRLRSEDEAEELKDKSPRFVGQNWQRTSGSEVDVDALREYGLKLTSFGEFLMSHKPEVLVALRDRALSARCWAQVFCIRLD